MEDYSLEFLPQTDVTGLRASGRRDIHGNKNEIVEVGEATRAMEVAGMEVDAPVDDG